MYEKLLTLGQRGGEEAGGRCGRRGGKEGRVREGLGDEANGATALIFDNNDSLSGAMSVQFVVDHV